MCERQLTYCRTTLNYELAFRYNLSANAAVQQSMELRSIYLHLVESQV